MSSVIEWCTRCGVRPAKRIPCGIPVYLPCEECLRESTEKILAGVKEQLAEIDSMRVNSLLGSDHE